MPEEQDDLDTGDAAHTTLHISIVEVTEITLGQAALYRQLFTDML